LGKNPQKNFHRPSSWGRCLSFLCSVCAKRGKCVVSGTGTPDGWQCHFSKPGYAKKFRMYGGPSDFSAEGGPGPAYQEHTEMLVSTNASWTTYPRIQISTQSLSHNQTDWNTLRQLLEKCGLL
jgi:hypothetical protein